MALVSLIPMLCDVRDYSWTFACLSFEEGQRYMVYSVPMTIVLAQQDLYLA